jgi:DNA helicase HerA-like ATPase
MVYREILETLRLEEHFGILAEASTDEITVYARNQDTAVGDFFLIPSDRGGERLYLFRMVSYTNDLRRDDEMDPMAKNIMAMPDSFQADDFDRDRLLRLSGSLLGYAEQEGLGTWRFHPPRKLPEHLSAVYKIGFGSEEHVRRQEAVLAELLARQLQGGVFIGHLLAGERPLMGVPVGIPGEYFAHHIGIFGRTGVGKSNNLMVMTASVFDNNRRIAMHGPTLSGDRRVSLFAVDPHDEFAKWKADSRGGITRLIRDLSPDERREIAEPFFYLSCRPQEALDSDADLMGLGRQCILHRHDITPEDVISIMEFTDVMTSASAVIHDEFGQEWITAILNGDVRADEEDERWVHRASLAAINRRLAFLAAGRSSLVAHDPTHPIYRSVLADIVLALERGRVLDIETTLMTEIEQFLLTTVVARTVFALRKALKSSPSRPAFFGTATHAGEIDRYLPLQNSLKLALTESLGGEDSPYFCGDTARPIAELPAVNLIIEEAPSVLNPARIRFGSVFREIARQGRKFGVGLTVVSQQVTEIDKGILSQLNTELNLALGNDEERRAAVATASNDIFPFKRELQVMGVGQAILSASYKNLPFAVQIPEFQ